MAASALLLPDFLLIALGATLRRVSAWCNGIKLGLLPAIAFGLSSLFGLSTLERQVAVLLAAVRTAPSSDVLAMQMNGMGAPVALLISSGTFIAIATLPLWLALVA